MQLMHGPACVCPTAGCGWQHCAREGAASKGGHEDTGTVGECCKTHRIKRHCNASASVGSGGAAAQLDVMREVHPPFACLALTCAVCCAPLPAVPWQEAAYWWSWSVTHWLTLAASGLLCAVVGLYPFRHSAFGLMLAFYWLFSAALISFSYFLSTLFSASRVAGTATQFIYALSMIPGWVSGSAEHSWV